MAVVVAILGVLAFSVDRREFVYRDVGVRQRPVAVVEVTLRQCLVPATVRLELVARARDPRLRPALGSQGVAGQNAATAREFAGLLRPGTHAIVTDGDIRGRFAAAGTGRFVARTVTPRPGSFGERTAAPVVDRIAYALALPFPEPRTRHRTEVWVAGWRRLVVVWEAGGGRPARIVSVAQPPPGEDA